MRAEIGENGGRAAAFDDEGGLLWMGADLRRLLDIGPEDDLSETIWADLYPDEEYERIVWDAHRDAFVKGSWCGRVVMQTKHGRRFQTYHRVEAQTDSSGYFAGLTIHVELIS